MSVVYFANEMQINAGSSNLNPALIHTSINFAICRMNPNDAAKWMTPTTEYSVVSFQVE